MGSCVLIGVVCTAPALSAFLPSGGGTPSPWTPSPIGAIGERT